MLLHTGMAVVVSILLDIFYSYPHGRVDHRYVFSSLVVFGRLASKYVLMAQLIL